MRKTFRIKVWGDYALYTRPEMKVERYSYDVITPSAARGILDSIFWKPPIRWVIDKIYVLNPISFKTLRRNEVKSKIKKDKVLQAYNGSDKPLYLNTQEDIAQRLSVILRDVSYVIEAHIELADKTNTGENLDKYNRLIESYLKKGKCFKTPYFGCKEFPADFSLYTEEEIHTAYDAVPVYELGIMLYDIDYSNLEDIQPIFFRATMKNGVIDLKNCEVIR